MIRKLQLVAVALVAISASAARADYVSVKKETFAATSVAASTLASTRYTGWLPVQEKRSVVLEIAFTRSAATNVTMTCQSTNDTTTANGSGFDVHILGDSGTVGTSDSTPHTWRYTTSTTKKWSWTVSNLPHNYVNCAFAGASGGSSDLLTVRYSGVTP